MKLAKEEKPMPTKRTTKRTAATVATTPMTVADALEAGRRAYEAAAGSTGTAMPTAEPRRSPATMQTRHEKPTRRNPNRSRSRLDQRRANTQ
jgi:hypothetical protein